MKLSASMIDQLQAGGMSADTILIMVKVALASEEKLSATKREKNRDRMRTVRAVQAVQRTECTAMHTPAIAVPEISSHETHDAGAAEIAPANSKKESSPIPPKEKLSPQEKLAFREEIQTKEVEVGDTRARGRSGRGARLPDDWMPSLGAWAFAVKLFGDDRAGQVRDEFRDYWHARAGPLALKCNWDATWRNRCREVAKINGTNGNGQHRENRITGFGENGQRGGGGLAAFALRSARAAGKT